MNDPYAADFRNFLFEMWRFLKLPAPTELQYDIASFLQHGPARRVIEGFRGVAKSWEAAAYVLWRLRNNPQLNILIVSASKTRADEFSTFLLHVIEEFPLLQHLRPKEGQRESKVAFDVRPAEPDQNPSVKSAGITGQITGSRADIIIADDVEITNNSATQMMRAKLSDQIKEFDAIVKPGGEIIYLGTPQTESSIYNKLTDRGFTFRVWPVRYPTEEQRDFYGDQLGPCVAKALANDPSLAGKSTEPTRFTEEDLIARELSWGRSGFALQFMLDTRMSDANRYPLRLRDLLVSSLDPNNAPEKIVWSNAPEYAVNDIPNVGIDPDKWFRPVALTQLDYKPYETTVMSIDPSGRGSDETAYSVVSSLHANLYLRDNGGFMAGFDEEEVLVPLALIAKKHKVNLIRVEENFGGGMFASLLKPVLARIYPCTIEEVRHNVQKERRICDTLEPVMNSHRLVIERELIVKDYNKLPQVNQDEALRYSLFYQMTRVTRDRKSLVKDDRLDSLAMAVAFFVDQMQQNQDDAIKRTQQAAADKELTEFMDHVFGSKQTELRWF